MVTSIWIRPGEDAAAAHAIREEVFQRELGFSPEDDRDLMDPYGFHLVLKLNDIPVAAGRITYGSVGTAKLDRICVLPKYRCQGIGDGLVKILDFKASQMGMQYSVVETIPEKEAFYNRIGYRATGETKEKYGRSLIVMKKECNDGTVENCAHQRTCQKGEI